MLFTIFYVFTSFQIFTYLNVSGFSAYEIFCLASVQNFVTPRMEVTLSGGFHEASSSIQNGTRWVSEPRRQLIKISSIIRV